MTTTHTHALSADDAPVTSVQVMRAGNLLSPDVAQFLASEIADDEPWTHADAKPGKTDEIVFDQKQCVFYNEGCVLHAIGAAEGDSTKYKPATCILFPIDDMKGGGYEVRQWGRKGEMWNLFCLDPTATKKSAKDTLKVEVEFLTRIENGEENWRG